MGSLSSEDLFEMDECMKQFIISLNNQGIETISCCSGHEKGMEYHSLSLQENFLNHKYQIGMKAKDFFNQKMNGLIVFKRKKDRDMVLAELKKTEYGNRFVTYFSFMGRRLYEPKHIIFKTKGLSQNEIERFWRSIKI
jgi:hypothetical protein